MKKASKKTAAPGKPKAAAKPKARKTAATGNLTASKAAAAAKSPKKEAPVSVPMMEPQPAAGQTVQATMQASRRFWMTFLGVGVLAVVLVQGYGYMTGWGNPEKVVQRRFSTAQRLTLAKRYPAAIRQYQKIIEQSKDAEIRRQASIAVADLYREQKDWPNAVQMYEKLQGQDDGTVMAAWTGLKIAECRHEAGQSEAALATFGKIREQFPNTDWDAEARLGMGKVYMDEQSYEKAIEVYGTLEKDYRGGFLAAEALVHIGECYAKMGDEAKARATFQGIVNSYPETMTDEAKKYLKRMDDTEKPEGVRLWGE